MENEKNLIEKIYELSAESRLANEKMSTNFEMMNKRVETLENLTQSMAQNIAEIKHLQSIVDSISKTIYQNSEAIKDLQIKCHELEEKPIKDRANRWNYIIDTTLKTIFSLVLSVVLIKIGLQK